MLLGGREVMTVKSYVLAYLPLPEEPEQAIILFQTPAKIRGKHLEVPWGEFGMLMSDGHKKSCQIVDNSKCLTFPDLAGSLLFIFI
jgi:hypothetical protein